MDIEELKEEIDAILHPEPGEDGNAIHFPPHKRLSTVYGLDTSYYKGPYWFSNDKKFEFVLRDDKDPLHDTLQSITVPYGLYYAALNLFGDSIIEYYERDRHWDLYRYYPSILMTAWAAFESWVRISSEIYIKVVPSIPDAVQKALAEVRTIVDDNGRIKNHPDRRPVLERYWLLLKNGCNIKYNRGDKIWQAGKRMSKVRDSLAHYDVSEAPTIKASELWGYLETELLLFIAPSAQVNRTLFYPQFDMYFLLAELKPFIKEFEEQPLHKGWPRGGVQFSYPFDGVDTTKYTPCRRPEQVPTYKNYSSSESNEGS